MKLGLIGVNPCDGVDPPQPVDKEMKILLPDEVSKFLATAQKAPWPYYYLFYTMLFTGLQRSEVLALTWGKLDLELCTLSVTQTLHQVRGGKIIFKQPKTEKSRRLVALTPSTAALLKEHQESQNKLRESLGYPKLMDSDLVFCQYNGKPLLPNTVTHNWIKLVCRTGLHGIRFHDARHTHASLMLKQGVHPKIVQERLGHASIQVTLDTYSHVTPGLQEAAAVSFDDIVLSNYKVKSQ